MFKKTDLTIINALIENSPMAIIMLDMNGRVIEWNPAAERIFGWAKKEIMGKPNPIVPEDKQDEYAALRHQVEEGKPYSGRNLLRKRKDGTLIYINISSALLYDEKGSKIGLVGIAEDITERIKSDENRRIFTELIDASPASITVHDFEGNFLYANQKTLDLHGFTKEELLSKNLHEIDVPASKELIAQRMNELREKGEAFFEVAHYRKDSTTFPLRVYAKTALWNDCKVILSVASDITELKMAENKLTESQKFMEMIIEAAPT
ncbi:MAG: PAS domain S-box protein [Nitrospirae bacterium]|nr:PAS domain S-box protein [Nitrospirota bacterium]